jgi:hypothetical protein
MHHLSIFVVNLALALALAPLARGGEAISVRLEDGRILTGLVDARTDAHDLWLRREQGAVVMASNVAWDEVASGIVNQRTIEANELRDMAGDLATTGTPLFSQRTELAGGEKPHTAPRTVPVRLRSLEIVDACLVNLDRDVEPDGLSVAIAAIGEDGRPMAVRGSLAARLFGESRPNDAPVVAFPELDRWTQPVSSHDFVDGVATYELRFRGIAPERQFHLLPDAVLELRLGAFGQGNYSASAPVVLRLFNPLRDHRQLRYGSRFLPQELQGRPPASSPAGQDGLWIHWTW